jgi:hypothetical protein
MRSTGSSSVEGAVALFFVLGLIARFCTISHLYAHNYMQSITFTLFEQSLLVSAVIGMA